ncbi:MAG: hypothetical protein J6125_01485, partial [Clostridia bacterium]|nr:hypothetical protein [Clostridia bacterium]
SDLAFSGFVQGGDVSGDIVGGLIGRIYAQRQISDYGAPKSTRVSRTFVAYESYTVAPTLSCVIVTGDLEADTAAALIVGLIERNAAPSFSISDLYSASAVTADGLPVADPAGYNLLLYVEDEMTTYYNRNVENSSEIMMGVASGSPVSCDLSTSVYDAADLTNYSAVASLTAHQQAETVWAQSDVGPVPVVADIAAHTVTYKTADGAGTLGTRLIIHGNSGVACAPAAPAVASMTFEGWSGSVAAVTSDATVLATYSYREYLSALTFDAAYLTLTDSFAVNMLIALPDDGAIDDALASGDLVVRVICGGESYPITWADLSRGGVDYLRCTFGGLDAARMGETLTYQIRVCGEVVRSVDYSVLIYASRMYQKAGSSEQLKDLLVAMMVYGDAAEQKAGTDASETVLAAFKAAIGDDSVAPAKDYAALALTDESEGTGVSVALHLGARIEVRFAGLLSTPTVTAGGEDMAVTDNGDGTYSVFVNASGLHLKLCVNSAVTFSVGDYIARGIAGSLFSAAEQAVAQALAVYMDATLTYAGSLG